MMLNTPLGLISQKGGIGGCQKGATLLRFSHPRGQAWEDLPNF